MLCPEVARASMQLPFGVQPLLLDFADISGWSLPGINMSQATDQTAQLIQIVVYALESFSMDAMAWSGLDWSGQLYRLLFYPMTVIPSGEQGGMG